jgi:AbrB family looped-hinge helix DNA binding protein
VEVARVTSKGQITIPRDIRVKMNLKKGDKVLFFEENNRVFLENSESRAKALGALKEFQESMRGEAEKAGFNTPEDVEKYIKSLRTEKNK